MTENRPERWSQHVTRWSQRVTDTSNALDLERGVFTHEDPRQIALSLKHSAEQSRRRKADPFRSAMSMLTFYINRAGRHLPELQRARLEAAKDELRALYGKPVRLPRWEHFPHEADVGVRGVGATLAHAFEQAATAMTAAITAPATVKPEAVIWISCDAPDAELLLVDWLNALIYEMATRSMLFCRFDVQLQGHHLTAQVWGETIEVARHHPATEVKGATCTELKVARQTDGSWLAQCVVDV